MANNEVRIIGGQWKGRKLRFANRPGLRPTLGRVRETLFNWLGPHIVGARCLDLYAGSGALGFEALSRGAAEVTFVERDRKTSGEIKANVRRLDTAGTVVCNDVRRFLRTKHERWDIVFCDPPFSERLPAGLVTDILQHHLAADGFLYLEAPRRSHPPESACPVKSAIAGDCRFALYRGA
ncbi:MAG: 16S rRNA (guanine(966)-N(2))-methyltransferase RsmD [Gammaproteobacteria bacterium]|jgi:16S rRNA (guanine966-N2)-methyltransferase